MQGPVLLLERLLFGVLWLYSFRISYKEHIDTGAEDILFTLREQSKCCYS